MVEFFAYADQLSSREPLSSDTSLAEFGRSIGNQEIDRLMALVGTGSLPVRALVHPITRRLQLRVDEQIMTAFKRRSLTLGMIQPESVLQRMSARILLRDGDITAYTSAERTFDRLFLRA